MERCNEESENIENINRSGCNEESENIENINRSGYNLRKRIIPPIRYQESFTKPKRVLKRKTRKTVDIRKSQQVKVEKIKPIVPFIKTKNEDDDDDIKFNIRSVPIISDYNLRSRSVKIDYVEEELSDSQTEDNENNEAVITDNLDNDLDEDKNKEEDDSKNRTKDNESNLTNTQNNDITQSIQPTDDAVSNNSKSSVITLSDTEVVVERNNVDNQPTMLDSQSEEVRMNEEKLISSDNDSDIISIRSYEDINDNEIDGAEGGKYKSFPVGEDYFIKIFESLNIRNELAKLNIMNELLILRDIIFRRGTNPYFGACRLSKLFNDKVTILISKIDKAFQGLCNIEEMIRHEFKLSGLMPTLCSLLNLMDGIKKINLDAVKYAYQNRCCIVCFDKALLHCCWDIFYCGIDCQIKDWINHNRICLQIALPATDPDVALNPINEAVLNEICDVNTDIIRKYLKPFQSRPPPLLNEDCEEGSSSIKIIKSWSLSAQERPSMRHKQVSQSAIEETPMRRDSTRICHPNQRIPNVPSNEVSTSIIEKRQNLNKDNSKNQTSSKVAKIISKLNSSGVDVTQLNLSRLPVQHSTDPRNFIDLPSTSTGITHNFPSTSTGITHNLPSTSTGITHNNFPSTSTGMTDNNSNQLRLSTSGLNSNPQLTSSLRSVRITRVRKPSSNTSNTRNTNL